MIPVICTAKIKPELINDFLLETYAGFVEAPESLVVITTTDWSYYYHNEDQKRNRKGLRTHGGGPMKIPSRPPWTEDFDSPFLGQTPEEVAKTLREAEGAPGHLHREHCAILDEQTLEDRTVFLVQTERSKSDNLPDKDEHENAEIVKIRSSFGRANGTLQSVSVAVGSLVSDIWNETYREGLR